MSDHILVTRNIDSARLFWASKTLRIDLTRTSRTHPLLSINRFPPTIHVEFILENTLKQQKSINEKTKRTQKQSKADDPDSNTF